MRINYPDELNCPHCKTVIRLDYSDRIFAQTEDLLIMNIEVPLSQNSAKDKRSNKQNIGTAFPRFVICQHCKTILGTYDYGYT
jgi:hypothetical protein